MGNVASRLLSTPPAEIALSAIVLFELEVGISKSMAPRKKKPSFRNLPCWLISSLLILVMKILINYSVSSSFPIQRSMLDLPAMP